MKNALRIIGASACMAWGIGTYCQPPPTAMYDLTSPSRRFQLPAELREISALTDMSGTTVACLQDEQGTIFLLDHTTGAIIQRMAFAGAGDFEGLTRIGNELFALRSDGLIYRLEQHEATLALVDTFRAVVPNLNLESLGYDEKRQVLLIAAKDILKGEKEVRDLRFIYGWDMHSGQQLATPVLTLSVKQILEEAEALGVEVPMVEKNGRMQPRFKLRPSSVAVHPADDSYWVLSAKDHALLVLDREGHLMDLRFLDPNLFPKAEGITFLANGDLLISSEGKDGDGVLLFFAKR